MDKVRTILMAVMTLLLVFIALRLAAGTTVRVEPSLYVQGDGTIPAVYRETSRAAAPPVSGPTAPQPIPAAGLMDSIEKAIYISMRFLVRLLALVVWIVERGMLYVGLMGNGFIEGVITEYALIIEQVAADMKPLVRAMAGFGLLLAGLSYFSVKLAKYQKVLLWMVVLSLYFSDPIVVYETLEDIRIELGETIISAVMGSIHTPCTGLTGACPIEADELSPVPVDVGACFTGGHVEDVQCSSIGALPQVENATLEIIPASIAMEPDYDGNRQSIASYFHIDYDKADKMLIVEWPLKALLRLFVTLPVATLVAVSGAMTMIVDLVAGILFILIPAGSVFAFFETFDAFPKRIAMTYVSLMMITPFVYGMVGVAFVFIDLAMTGRDWTLGGTVIRLSAAGLVSFMVVWMAITVPFSVLRNLFNIFQGMPGQILSQAGATAGGRRMTPSAISRFLRYRVMQNVAGAVGLGGRRRTGRRSGSGGDGSGLIGSVAGAAAGAVTGGASVVAGAAGRALGLGGDDAEGPEGVPEEGAPPPGGGDEGMEPASTGVVDEARERMGQGQRRAHQEAMRGYLTGESEDLPDDLTPETRERLQDLREQVERTPGGEDWLHEAYSDPDGFDPPPGMRPAWAGEARMLGERPIPTRPTARERRRRVRHALVEETPEEMLDRMRRESMAPPQHTLGLNAEDLMTDIAESTEGLDPSARRHLWDAVNDDLEHQRDMSSQAFRDRHGQTLQYVEQQMLNEGIPRDEVRQRIEGAVGAMEEAALSEPEPMFQAPRRPQAGAQGDAVAARRSAQARHRHPVADGQGQGMAGEVTLEASDVPSSAEQEQPDGVARTREQDTEDVAAAEPSSPSPQPVMDAAREGAAPERSTIGPSPSGPGGAEEDNAPTLDVGDVMGDEDDWDALRDYLNGDATSGEEVQADD